MSEHESGFKPHDVIKKEETIQQRLDRVKKTAGVPVISKEHLENLSKGFHEAALLEQQFRAIEKLASVEDDKVKIFVEEWIREFQDFKDNPDPHKKHPGVFDIPMKIRSSIWNSGYIEGTANSDTIEMENRYQEREKRLSRWVKRNVEEIKKIAFTYLLEDDLEELGYITHEESLEKRKKEEGDAVEIKGETEEEFRARCEQITGIKYEDLHKNTEKRYWDAKEYDILAKRENIYLIINNNFDPHHGSRDKRQFGIVDISKIPPQDIKNR